jgi:hypothetical protein
MYVGSAQLNELGRTAQNVDAARGCVSLMQLVPRVICVATSGAGQILHGKN